MMIGPHVAVAAIEPEDLPAIVQWRNDPDVYQGFIEYEPLSASSQQRFMDSLASNPTRRLWSILLRDSADRTCVGCVGLIDLDMRNRRVELGPIFVGEKQNRGSGVARESELLVLRHCFDHLGMNRVYAYVRDDNPDGITFQEACGLKRECVLREHIYENGRFLDEVVLSVLVDEWRQSEHASEVSAW